MSIGRLALSDAIIAALNDGLGALPTPRKAYTISDAPQSGGGYVIVSLNREDDSDLRRNASIGRRTWFLEVEAIGAGAAAADDVAALLDVCESVLADWQPDPAHDLSALVAVGDTESRQDIDETAIYFGTASWRFTAA